MAGGAIPFRDPGNARGKVGAKNKRNPLKHIKDNITLARDDLLTSLHDFVKDKGI